MYKQMSIFGNQEEVKVDNNAKKFESILKELELLKSEENNKRVEIGAFEVSRTNSRPLIHIFVEWIGYAMFIKDLKFEKLDKEKQDVYHEVWKKCIKPMYYEFCNQFGHSIRK